MQTFCSACGSQLKPDSKFCVACGSVVNAESVAGTTATPVQEPVEVPPSQPMNVVDQNPVENPGVPPQQPPMGGTVSPQHPPNMGGSQVQMDPAMEDASQNKGMAALCYIFPLIPFLMNTHKSSDFVKFHLNYGVILWGASIALYVVFSIFSGIMLGSIIRGSGGSIWRILLTGINLVSLGVLIIAIIGLIAACKGEKKELPIINQFDIIK